MVILSEINYDTLKNEIDFINKYKFNIEKNSIDNHPFHVFWKDIKDPKIRKKTLDLIYNRCSLYKCFENCILKLLIPYHSNDKNAVKNWRKCSPLLTIGRAFGNAASYAVAPYYIRLYIGNKGYFITIRDSGNGFNHKDIIKKYNENKKYWNNKGGGFQLFINEKTKVCFSNSGKKITLIYLK